jgi:2-keto-4-pentenoate hydratase/2-oxohepta-3-ene-1,7-dioic acid hydratase in catechol pathway
MLVDGRVVDAWAALGEPHRGSLRELIEHGRIDDLHARIGDTGAPSHPLSAVTLLPPIPDPEKIICIGLNYVKHAEEGRHELPTTPIMFGKWRNSLVADGATVTLPDASRKVDYEAEVAFVIGRRAHSVAEADALDFVAGYTLFNDLSARDLQFATPQWTAGKVFDGSAPCGPAIVTPDEAGPADGIGIALDLNGERMQESTTAELIFGVTELLAHLSTLMTLVPGDIVSTGTPAGVGGAREPRVWLRAGDELVVSSPELGELRTTIR